MGLKYEAAARTYVLGRLLFVINAKGMEALWNPTLASS